MPTSASSAAVAVKQALQQFLQQEDAYLLQLDSVESEFAKKLRFQLSTSTSSSPRSSSVSALEDQVKICRFVDALAQLRHLHRVFGVSLQALATASVVVSSLETRLVDALDDMLNVIRYQYGQLYCNDEAIQTLLEKARSASNGSLNHSSNDFGSTSVLQHYLAKEGISVKELVMRPLNRFHAIVEFVEALSSLCTDSATVLRLRQLAEHTRQYIHVVQSESRDEQELIALQAQIVPNAVCAKLDLSAEKLLVHSEIGLVALRNAADAICDFRAETLYAHCFQSGKFIYSKRESSVGDQGSADRFFVRGCLELKQDPVFFECVPDAVLDNVATIKGAFALLSSQESAFFGVEDSQQWSTTTKSLLSQNETRTHVLRSQRSFDDIEIPQEIAKQLKLKKKRNSLVSSPFFHDDDLPGIFWLESEVAGGGGGKWELVELMFHDQWLLISKVLGWKHHSLLHHLDCQSSTIDIRDEPNGENDWSLVISIAQGDQTQELKLVSKRRSRIDFWFDQISKAVTPSTQYEDSELPPNESAGVALAKSRTTEEQPFINARAKRNKSASVSAESADGSVEESSSSAKKVTKKRKSGERESETQSSDVANQVAEKKPKKEKNGGAESTKRKKAGSKIDSLVQVAQEALESATTANEPKSRRKDPVVKKADDISKLQSPAIKTPKRRWLKLKVEDPDDSILLDTDVSQDTTADETTSNDARQSQSQNLKSDIRIILTGIEPSPTIRKKIKAVGSVYEDDIEKATHVIAPKNQLKRTVKLLCGISRCDHILDEKWLNESAKAGVPLSEQDYCLLDTKAQEKWHFDLHKTMYEFTPEQRRQLFVGHTVFITNHKSVLPPVKDLVKIVECAGGKAEVKGGAGPSDLVITSEAALSVLSVQKSLAGANPQRIYSPELILSSILQQHIDFDKNRLELSSTSSSFSGGSRNRRSGQ